MNAMSASTKSEPIPVAAYLRYSTALQDQRSNEDQLRRCRRHAAANGMNVVEVYSDEAESGSHIDRAGMQRLLADAKRRGMFRAVLVDDLSRLSRDLGQTWSVVFGDLAHDDIAVIDVTTGMSSSDPNARIMFAAMGMVNDQFLQSVRKQTHRGLEGRALSGHWPGGRVFGYKTVEEENPPDPAHPRKRPVVDDTQAPVVKRIFEMYDNGAGLKQIASTLNDEGIPAPNDGGRGNKRGRGWGPGTIRAMLCNARYIGDCIWNQHRWIGSGKKHRRRVKRPESEWIRLHCPELAIIDRKRWDTVQARFRRHAQKGLGRPAGTGSKRSPLVSGLLRCGECGGSMTIVGARKKGPTSYARFGCSSHYNRGASICANAVTLSERKITAALLAALTETLGHPDHVKRFVEQAQREMVRLEKKDADDDGGERRVRECERRIARLTETLAKLGWSDAIAAKLKEEEAHLARLKVERAKSAKPAGGRSIPEPKVIAEDFRRLHGILKADAVRGRELLARFVSPLVMTPKVEGPSRSYRATGAVNLSFFVEGTRDGASNSGCAGRI